MRKAAVAQTVGPTLAASFFVYGLSIGVAGLAFTISAAITLATIPLIVNVVKREKG